MTDKALAIYCLLDDMFQIMGLKTDPHCKLNDAEVATTALMAALFFYGNQTTACDYMQHHMGCQMIDKSGFNRRLHRLENTLLVVFRALGLALKELNTSARYIIDSFPVAVCRNCRIPVCKLLKGKAYHGYNQAKKEYFYGFKVQLITTAAGQPVNYYVSAGSFHDSTAFQSMQLDLPAGSMLYGDSGYTDYEQEELYADCEQVTLLIHRKRNSKRPDEAWQRFLKKYFRKPIETVISQIETLFPRKIHAVTVKGFLLKVFLFVLAYAIDEAYISPSNHAT
ncbi:IS982 family transposase [Spirosoma litoris]